MGLELGHLQRQHILAAVITDLEDASHDLLLRVASGRLCQLCLECYENGNLPKIAMAIVNMPSTSNLAAVNNRNN